MTANSTHSESAADSLDGSIRRCDEPAATIQRALDESSHVPQWADLSVAEQTQLLNYLLDDGRLNRLIEARNALRDSSSRPEDKDIIEEQLFAIFGNLDSVIIDYVTQRYHAVVGEDTASGSN